MPEEIPNHVMSWESSVLITSHCLFIFIAITCTYSSGSQLSMYWPTYLLLAILSICCRFVISKLQSHLFIYFWASDKYSLQLTQSSYDLLPPSKNPKVSRLFFFISQVYGHQLLFLCGTVQSPACIHYNSKSTSSNDLPRWLLQKLDHVMHNHCYPLLHKYARFLPWILADSLIETQRPCSHTHEALAESTAYLGTTQRQ